MIKHKQLTELQRLLYQELFKKSFYEFAKEFWNEADPHPFVDGVLIQFYCESFQYMCRKWIDYKEVDVKLPKLKEDEVLIDVRENKNRLNINVPPRHTKSMIFNVLGPTWLFTYYPIIAASISHNAKLAKKMNSRRYKIINSEKYKALYNIELMTNTTEALLDTRGGELYSQSRESMTGSGADLLINDDIMNAETAKRDKEEAASARSYYTNTMPSRVNDINKCIIINIMQRLAPNDITGMIESDQNLRNNYTFIVLPAQFNKTTYLVCPISGKIIKFNKGDYLWPERFGDYAVLKADVGQTTWETQYLQNPVASDATIVKPDMIIEKDLLDTPGIENSEMIYSSNDFPVKDKESSDFLGSVLAYRVHKTIYITDCLEKHLAFIKSVEYIKAIDNLYPYSLKIIEDKANGSPILQALQDEVTGLQAFNPGTNSKVTRLETASMYMNNIVFVKTKFNKQTNRWEFTENMNNLINRLLSFPMVEHDDIVDAFSMLILFIFVDRKYLVYGRALNDENIISQNEYYNNLHSNIFINKEGDVWKVLEVAIDYKEKSELIIRKETYFRANIQDGLSMLKELFPKHNVFIDCSFTDSLTGMYKNNITVERYEDSDFEKSVSNLNLLFSSKRIKIYNNCNLIQADLDTFKYAKSKDENVKFITTKDGFIACLRIARMFYGL